MSPSSSVRDFAQYAGRFLWPRSGADLTDTTLCPACRAPLSSAVCSACGLDLRHPAARALLTASTDAATALDRRVQLIGQIRYETAEALATATADAQRQAAEQAAAAAALAGQQAEARRAAAHAESQRLAAQAAAVATHHLPAPPAAAPASPAVPAPPAPATSTGPAAHKRSGVQVVLLIVGVTLVSIAAIFFLTVAFIFTGLAFKAIVVAVLTLGTLVTAALLRRKGLLATAEGIGALAVVLVLLDVWAMRRLDLFGLAGGDGLLYWGGALLACTVVFLAWHALSKLRVASVAGFAAAAPAVGLLAAGIASDAEPLTRLFVGFAGAGAGALLHRFTLPGTVGAWPSLDRRAERVALLAVAGFALGTAAILAGLIEPATAWAPLVSFGVVAGLATAHAHTALRRPDAGGPARVAAHLFVALAVVCGAAGVLVSTLRGGEPPVPVLAAPLLVAAGLALGFELAWRRRPAGPVRSVLCTGMITAMVPLTLIGQAVLITAAIPLATALTGYYPDPIARPLGAAGWSLAALAGVAVLGTVFWRLGGVLAARRPVLAWFGLALALVAVPFTQWLWLILPLYLLLGALALVALFLARSRRPGLRRFRPPLVALLVAAEAAGYVIGWRDASTWWLGSVSVVLALVLARLLLNPQTRAHGRGALLSGAIVVTLIGVAAAPWQLTRAAPPTDSVLLVHVLAALGLAAGVLALFVAQTRIGHLGPVERRWAFWTLLAPTLVVVAAPAGRLLEALPAAERATVAVLLPTVGILATALVLAASVLWTLRTTVPLAGERFTATLLVAPALLALAVNLVQVTDAAATVSALVAPTAALLTAALALTLRVTQPVAGPVADQTTRPVAGPVADQTAGPVAGRVAGVAGWRSARGGLGLEIGAAVVLASAYSRLDLNALGWLVLVFTAVTVLITAVDADGLFASGSWRRHLGWLSLTLATAGLWWGLGNAGSTPLEAYVLPVAGTVLALAALLWRYGRVDRTVAASPGAALLTLAGLSLALLPLALSGQTGSLLRPVLVAVVSAVLLLGAARVRWTSPRWAFLAAAGLAGAAGLLVTGVARSLRVLTAAGSAGPLLEAWLLPGTLVLIAAAVLLVRQHTARSPLTRQRAGGALVLVALTTLTVLECLAFDSTGLGAGRAIGLVLLLGALHVLPLRAPRAPFGVLTAWCAAGLAGITVLAALVVGAVEPFEAVVVPLGLALVAGQLLRNRPWAAGARPSTPAASYWLGAGLALILLPSAGAAAGPGATTLGVAAAGSTSLGLGITDDALRQLLTLTLGGALALGGAVLLSRPRWRLLAWPGVVVGAVTVLVTAAGRIQPLLDTLPDWRVEAWLLPVGVLIAAGAVIIIGCPVDTSGAAGQAAPPIAPRRVLGYGLVAVALFGVFAAEAAALSYPPYAEGRMLVLIALAAVLHVAVRWFDRSPAGAALAWFALTAGLLSLLLGQARDLLSPLELGTVPLGLALVAGQLIALGLLGRRPAPRAGTGLTPASRTAAQAWLAAGLALALLPSAVAGADGTVLRPVLTLALGGAAGILGALLLRRAHWRLLAWPACLVGTPVVTVTAGLRILPLYSGPTGPTGQLEAWLIPAALLLVATGAGLVWTTWVATGVDAAPAPGAGRDRAVLTGYGLVLVALAGVVLAELPALGYAPLATVRVVLVVWLFSALYLAVFWVDESRLGRIVAWASLGGAAVVIVGGWTVGVPDPVEIVTVPLALALVASGLLHLDRVPGARSWIALAPGLLVLLVPSLFLDLGFSPLWRVVGLGVLAIAVLLLGTVRRLQAPFVIGATVLLVHALAQLWPWISAAYGVVPWWLWLGIGGVLLIVLAARYEQRIQNLKTVALRISALR